MENELASFSIYLFSSSTLKSNGRNQSLDYFGVADSVYLVLSDYVVDEFKPVVLEQLEVF